MTAAIARPTVVSRAEHRHWRQFRIYWFGHLLSITGDWFTILALPLVAASVLDRGAYIGVVAASELVATPLLGMPSGLLADRLDPRRTMRVADVVRAILVAGLAVWVSGGRPPLWVLPTAAFVLCGLRDLHDAAESVMVASLLPPNLLVRANGRFQISDGAGHVVGAVAAGAVAAVAPAAALGVDAVTFLVAAGAVNLMGSFAVERGEQPDAAPWRTTVHALREEDRYWRVIVTMAIANTATACFLAPFVVFARTELHLDATAIGITWAAMGAGGILAGLLLDRVAALRPAWALVATGTLALATGVVAVVRTWPVTVVAFTAIGAVLALGLATVGSLRHASFPGSLQGRVAMATRIAFVASVAPAVLLAGWLSDIGSVGPARTYLVFALVAAVATGIGVALRVDRLPLPTPDHATRLLPTDPADGAFWDEAVARAESIDLRQPVPPSESPDADPEDTDPAAGTGGDALTDHELLAVIAAALSERPLDDRT